MNLGKETTYREAERRCFLNYFSGRHKSEIGVKAKLDSEMMKTTNYQDEEKRYLRDDAEG